MRYIKNFAVLAIAVALLVGCKDNNVALEAPTPAAEVQGGDTQPQQIIYLNGEPVLGFSSAAYIPSSDADMELLSVQVCDTLHYFDRDAAFRTFCAEHGKLNIYEANAKLDIIAAKAEELGLLDENGAKGDDDVVPQEMADLWYELFGYDIEKGDGSKANVATTVSEACTFEEYRQTDKFKRETFILPMKRTLGDWNNRVHSIDVHGSVGATVFCHKKWFGKPRKWFWAAHLNKFYSVCNTEHDGKFCSFYWFF